MNREKTYEAPAILKQSRTASSLTHLCSYASSHLRTSTCQHVDGQVGDPDSQPEPDAAPNNEGKGESA